MNAGSRVRVPHQETVSQEIHTQRVNAHGRRTPLPTREPKVSFKRL
jgi:hypothetical protein